MTCPLCTCHDESILWQDDVCRVIRVDDADYPGFCRVIWNAHVAEMTDLEPEQRHHVMNVVYATEQVLRDVLQPHKINLASLGNMVPHLHWHVIARFTDDRHFPQPVWAAPERASVRRPWPDDATLRAALSSILDR